MTALRILTFVLSGAGLAWGGLLFLIYAGVNVMNFFINVFAFKPVPYVNESFITVSAVCTVLEIAFMLRFHWGSVLIPLIPLAWAWHLGLIGR